MSRWKEVWIYDEHNLRKTLEAQIFYPVLIETIELPTAAPQ